VIGMTPGWADEFGAALADQDEQRRSIATGMGPRKAWRRNSDLRRESVLRGASIGAKSSKRKELPALFPEDVKSDR